MPDPSTSENKQISAQQMCSDVDEEQRVREANTDDIPEHLLDA